MDELSFAEFTPATREAWRAAVDKVLKGADFDRRMVSRTEDGLAIQPLYGPDDAVADAGVPGAFPFERGTRAASAHWRVEQREAHPDLKTANAQALDDLQRGVEAIRFTIADPLAAAPTGVALTSPDELPALIDGIMTSIAPVSLEAGSRGTAFARALMALWVKNGDEAGRVVADLHVDPLAALARTGALEQTLDATFAELAALVGEVQASFPQARTLGVDLRLGHDGGAGPSLELAIGLAHAAEALRRLDAQGLDPKVAAAQTTFLVPVDDDVFMGIAKLRALRRCWATMTKTVGAEATPRIVAETSTRMLTQRDVYVNLLRNTVAAFAGGTGGADALTVLPFTAALGLPDKSARRMARNTQMILLGESGLDHVVDPAGGSWYVENLTDQLANAAWRGFQEIESAGGFYGELANGGLAKRIDGQWAKRAKALATRREMITGVSAFPLIDEHDVELDGFDGAPLYAALAAKRAPASVAVTPLPRRRLAEPYEHLRDAADKAKTRPQVLLLNLGSLAEATVRATWIKSLVEAGGLEAVNSAPVADAEAVKAASAGSAFVVLCSTDKRYETLAADAARAAKAAGVGTVALAGRPGDHEAAWREAGVDVFLYQGVDVLAELEAAHQRLGLAA